MILQYKFAIVHNARVYWNGSCSPFLNTKMYLNGVRPLPVLGIAPEKDRSAFRRVELTRVPRISAKKGFPA